MNESIIAKDSEICQNCAKCCKELFWIEYTDDFPLRLSWLNGIFVDFKEVYGKIFVRVKHKCKKLIKKEGKYFCEAYGSIRPPMCKQYPDNIPVVDWKIHATICPLLKERLENE